jgi:hypothetical protein
MAQLRVVHISDLHIGTKFVDYQGSRVSGFAAVSIGAMEQLYQKASRSQTSVPAESVVCCIVSGDLTAFGHGQEFMNAITYLGQGFGSRQIGLYYHSPRTWDGVLGNHDIWGGRTSFVAWHGSSDKKSKAENASGLTTSVRRGQFNFGTGPQNYINVDHLRVRFYFLDSTLPGWRNVFARGRVKLSDLEDLKGLVREDEDVDRKDDSVDCVLRIAVLHHPICRAWNGSLLQSMVLENSAEVIRTLEDAKFGLALCGHEHGFAYNGCGRSGHFYELTAGTALQIANHGGTNSFAIIEIMNPTPQVQEPDSYPTITVHFEHMTRNYTLDETKPNTFGHAKAWNDPIRVVPLEKQQGK